MVRDKSFYSDFEDEMEFIEGGEYAAEDISNPSVANLVAALERQKANLMAKKTKLEQQIEAAEKEIQKIDAQIATKKSS